MSILETCVDYKILKDNLTTQQLESIDKILKHFQAYQVKYDDGNIDIIGDYMRLYGNDYIIDWFEGLMSTEDFIEEIKRGNVYCGILDFKKL